MSPQLRTALQVAACFAVPALGLIPLNQVPSAAVDMDLVAERMMFKVGDLSKQGLSAVPLLHATAVGFVALKLPQDAVVQLPAGTLSSSGGHSVSNSSIAIRPTLPEGSMVIRPDFPEGKQARIETLTVDPGAMIVVETIPGQPTEITFVVLKGAVTGAVSIPKKIALKVENFVLSPSSQKTSGEEEISFEKAEAGPISFSAPHGNVAVTFKVGANKPLLDHWVPIAGGLGFRREGPQRLVMSSITGPGKVIISETQQSMDVRPRMTVEPSDLENFVLHGLVATDMGMRISMSGRLHGLTVGWSGGDNILPTVLQHYEAQGFLKSYYALIVVIGTALLAILTRMEVIKK